MGGSDGAAVIVGKVHSCSEQKSSNRETGLGVNSLGRGQPCASSSKVAHVSHSWFDRFTLRI